MPALSLYGSQSRVQWCLCANAVAARDKRCRQFEQRKSTTHNIRVVKHNQNPCQLRQSLHTCIQTTTTQNVQMVPLLTWRKIAAAGIAQAPRYIFSPDPHFAPSDKCAILMS